MSKTKTLIITCEITIFRKDIGYPKKKKKKMKEKEMLLVASLLKHSQSFL